MLKHEDERITDEGHPARELRDDDRRHGTPSQDDNGSGEVGLRGGSMDRGWTSPDGIGGDIGDADPNQPALFPIRHEISSSYTGPIPTPDMLAAYGDISPDFPDRILKMAERQVHGRDTAMQTGIKAESFAVKTSAVTAAVVSIGGLGATVVLIILGLPTQSLLTAIPAVLIGAGQLMNGIRKKSSDD